jgi:hypothetical protein
VKLLVLVLIALSTSGCTADAQTFDPHDPRSPLQFTRAIELPNVKGRIDHMALDAEHNHLFVAEYGNGSVDEVDLASGKVVGSISGLHEPQGVAWLSKQQEIAVASGDGLVTFYRGADRARTAVVRLGNDADNVRLDRRNGNIIVGYGSGGLAVIDPATHRVIRQLVLTAHPEAFELVGAKVFVNVPDAHEIAVGDIDQVRVALTIRTGLRFDNYPMASDAAGSQIAVGYRMPGTLSAMDAHSGAQTYSVPICEDADDLYFRSSVIIVVCGEGAIELVDGAVPHGAVRVTTQQGARTGLLDPEHSRLFVAVPAQQNGAAIWEMTFR